MPQDFNRIITLLRKERGITQKHAAQDLGVSQALLSHYEKGIRECGLDFVVRLADYYQVSCDYLLGRSPDRSGVTLTVDDLPAPESARDGRLRGSVLATLHKKLLFHSMNILFDKLALCQDKHLVSELSGYLMLAVYKMYRHLYAVSAKNSDSGFAVPRSACRGAAAAAMELAENSVQQHLAAESAAQSWVLTGEQLAKDYPLYATSLANLVRGCEERIQKLTTP